MNAQNTQTHDSLGDFWATRPVRPRSGRKIAGVAAGIGNRYGIDPVVVRVALIVMAIYGGAGVLLYLAGWLLLPAEGDEVSAGEALVSKGHSSTSKALTICLLVAMFPFGAWVFDGFFPAYIALLIGVGALFLLHRNRGPAAPQVNSVAQQETPAGAEPADAVPADAAAQEGERTTPPEWDPLGAAPFAWDLPEPGKTPEPDPEPEHRSKIGLFTLGALLVFGGVCAMLTYYVGGWFTAQHAVGIALGVIGIGLVAGAFARSGRGLIALAVPLALAGVAMTMGGGDGSNDMDDVQDKPQSISEVQREYERGAGSIKLDLSRLPNYGAVATKVHVGMGNAKIIVPRDADVELTCHTGMGNTKCLGRKESGRGMDMHFTDFGKDGPGGLKITLEVDAGTGNVEVNRD